MSNRTECYWRFAVGKSNDQKLCTYFIRVRSLCIQRIPIAINHAHG